MGASAALAYLVLDDPWNDVCSIVGKVSTRSDCCHKYVQIKIEKAGASNSVEVAARNCPSNWDICC